MTRTAHVLVPDQMADWEVGHLMTELRTGRFTGEAWTVLTVGATTDPVTTMGGLTIVPDLALADLDPAASDLLVMPGGLAWVPGREEDLVAVARRFLDAGVPVAAICGATEALARAGVLDERPHTGAALEALVYSGGAYAGQEHYVDARAVAADGLVTAGPQSPVQLATATLGLLGLASPEVLEAYEAVFDRGDASGYAVLSA